MFDKHKVMIVAIACCAASAAGATDYSIAISGEVPLICNATVNPSVTGVAPNGRSLGKLREFCNSAGGYRVYVDHSADLDGASLFVDGREIPLASNGSTLISSSSVPAQATHSLRLAGQKAANGTLSFRIEPL